MTSILKGAIYCRVSTDEQEAHGTSLQSQKLSCLRFASENKLTIPEEYIFLEQYSGGFLERPQLTHILLLASKGLIDFIIFMKRDRVARDTYVFHKIMNDLKEYNVKVFFSDEISTGDSAMDNFMGNTIIGFASREREQIKIRTNIGKRQHAKNNKWTFSHVPYGYIKNQRTKELEIFQEEKEVIQKIVKYYLDDNITMFEIAKRLSEEKILPPSFSLKNPNEKIEEKKAYKNSMFFWTTSHVQRILSRVKMYTGEFQGFKKEYKKKGNRSILIGERPKEEWITIYIPQIITKKQAKAIEEKVEYNRKFSKKRSVRSYMLQGKLFCDCEKPNFHNFIGYFHNQRGLRNYRCGLHNSSKYSIERLCSNHISGLKIEPIIVDTLKELFLDPEYILKKSLDIFTGNNGKDDEKDRYHELYYMIEEIDNKHKRNEELYVDGIIRKDRFLEIKKGLENKKEDIEKEMEKELEKIKSITLKETAKKTLNEINIRLHKEIEDFFEKASYDDLKELVNLVIDKVIIPKNKNNPVKIIMKIPCDNVSFSDKYYEEETLTFVDEYDKEQFICKTGDFVPKLLKLDSSKKPLLYRTVEFKESDDGDDFESIKNSNSFLFFLREKVYNLCNSIQFKNKNLSKYTQVFYKRL